MATRRPGADARRARGSVRRVVIACSIAAACRGGAAAPAAGTMPGYAPDNTPDSIRRELRRPENLLIDPPGVSGWVVKNALYVQFTDGASERAQNAALRAVGGTVIGGLRMKNCELYHIRIDVPRDSAAGPLLRARETLRALPQVQIVLFDIVGPAR